MNKIEHLGIAVKDLDAAEKMYEDLLGVQSYKREEVPTEGVTTSFFKCGESKIELLVGTNPNSPISRYVEKRGEGLHHIAYAVDDIRSEIERLKEKGFVALNEEPKIGADNKLVAFLHPKSAGGVLVELCQDRSPE
ncbi:methylmalonyl-CoA epimerase [Aureitalea marina]|uniref:Methylmalonyl-CoA epimerase n=1 Tax=Aureitalea marina TaxID=930804 RepID=A0A2S7KS41_9FLAO|nr:methylmalonyl-CoA epimerase [Aureitalea marina]PQB05436.1 methylmalonyl-CoA epimerase [Aureitalea marina]